MSEKPFVAFVGECSDSYLGHARSFASVSMQRSAAQHTHTQWARELALQLQLQLPIALARIYFQIIMNTEQNKMEK